MATYVCNVDCRGNAGYSNQIQVSDYVSESHARNTAYSNFSYPNSVQVGNNSNNQGTSFYSYFTPASESNKTSNPDYWGSKQWNVRFDCSAIPTTHTVTDVKLLQYIYTYGSSSTTWELHAINWQYYSNNSTGLPGTDISNWKTASSFNNLAITMNLTQPNSGKNNSFTGNATARSWINKGGWTHFVGVPQDFLIGGWQQGVVAFFLADSLPNYSYLTVTTTAGDQTSKGGWGFLF